MKIKFNGKIIAESNDTVIVEGNHYFPEKDVNIDLLEKSPTNTICPWKGKASYYSIRLNDEDYIRDAAWYYSDPKDAAKQIKGRVAFYKHKVDIEE